MHSGPKEKCFQNTSNVTTLHCIVVKSWDKIDSTDTVVVHLPCSALPSVVYSEVPLKNLVHSKHFFNLPGMLSFNKAYSLSRISQKIHSTLCNTDQASVIFTKFCSSLVWLWDSPGEYESYSLKKNGNRTGCISYSAKKMIADFFSAH